MYIKANHQTLAADTYRYIYFKVSNAVAVEGNIESLLGTYVTNQANYTYYRLFWDANIVFANNLVLPNTIAKAYAYYGMFEDCQNLLTAPALPATTLTTSCYKNMFKGCTRLKSQIVLPASTLKTQCYYGMFEGCTNLCHITCLATDISASNCTTNWVNGVAASGTFTKADGMTSWTTGNNGIPSGWTVQNA